jgi:hypothetical protein
MSDLSAKGNLSIQPKGALLLLLGVMVSAVMLWQWTSWLVCSVGI